MRNITRQEAEYLRANIPGVFIHVTSRGKSGRSKHYACEECSLTAKWLKKMEEDMKITRYGPAGTYTAILTSAEGCFPW